MRVTTAVLLALLVLAAAPAFVLSDEAQCDCSAQTKKAAQEAVQKVVAKVTEAEQQCDTSIQAIKAQHDKLLKEREAALSSSCSDKASAAATTIEELRTKLDSSSTHLEQLRRQLADAEQKLQDAEAHSAKLAASSSASSASFSAMRAELEDAKDKLAALEKAWVPLPAQTWLTQALSYAQDQYAKFAASELGQKAHGLFAEISQKAAELWKEAQPHVEAFLRTAQLKLKEAAAQGEVLYRKHVNDADWLREAQLKLDRVHGELRLVVRQALKDAPAPFNTSDPVMVQYIVYLIFSLPAILLVWLVAALTCGTRKPARTSSSGTSRSGRGGKRARA